LAAFRAKLRRVRAHAREGFRVTRVTWSRRVLRSRMRLRIDQGGFLDEAIARARAESAHGLAMQVLEIADAAVPGDNPQLIKNRCDQRRWLAGKYNALYSDKVGVTDSDGGSIA